MQAHACLANFVFVVEMGFLHVGQAGLELQTSGELQTSVLVTPALWEPKAGVTRHESPHLTKIARF